MKIKVLSTFIVALFAVLSVPVLASAEKQVVIDPGHGGKYTGTSGYSGSETGFYEKDANLAVSLKLRNILEKQGYTVNMTRKSDTYFASSSSKADLKARMKKANGFVKGNRNNAVFISIHHNSLPSDSSMKGFETYYFDILAGIDETYPPDPVQVKYSPGSRRFANTVYSEYLQNGPNSKGRGIIANDFFVTRNAHMPSALVEVGYMTNPSEENRIKSDDFQQKAAEGLANGINKYFDVFEVYDYKDNRIKTFTSKKKALNFAKSNESVYVFDKDRQKKIYNNVNARYEVHHSAKGLIHDPFVTKGSAITFAKKWRNTKVFDAKTEKVIWTFREEPYVVEHSSQGVLFDSYSKKDAISYAKKWKHTAVINRERDEVIWSNYLDKPYVVKHSSQGELFEANNENKAIAYAKKWKHTAVIVRETGEVIWSNYLDKPYVVEHSSQGELFDAYNQKDAIAYAKKWKHTSVIIRETGKAIWSNYQEVE